MENEREGGTTDSERFNPDVLRPDPKPNSETESTFSEIRNSDSRSSYFNEVWLFIDGQKTKQAVVVISKGRNGSLDEENGDKDRIYCQKYPNENFDDLVLNLSPAELYGELCKDSQWIK